MSEHYIDFMFLMQNELSFAIRSVKTILDNACLSTDKCDISMPYLSALKDPGTIIIVEAEQLLDYDDSRAYLFDLCIKENAKLVLIGWENDINRLKELASPSIVAACFFRPINAKDIADKLRDIIKQNRNKALRKNVLIVDDSPAFLRTVSDWLADSYNVSICPSATAAFHIIETNRPDLILLDYEMPVCSGAQFLEMLHSEHATENIPVIFLTSRSDPSTVKEVLSLKPQGYLLKSQPKQNILTNIKEFFMNRTADIVIENAEVWMATRNFAGRADRYGNSTPGFSIFLDPERTDMLCAEGWDVRFTRPDEAGETPRPYLAVSFSYDSGDPHLNPKIWKVLGNGNKILMNEATVASLDEEEFVMVDIAIRPSIWNVSASAGIRGYVREMFITVEESVLARKYFANTQPSADEQVTDASPAQAQTSDEPSETSDT